MKISSKNEFHSLVSTLCSLLKEQGIPIKTTRAQELLAHTLGYKSANGLYAAVPVDLTLTDKMFSTFRELLKERHSATVADAAALLGSLQPVHQIQSASRRSDQKYYPASLGPNENYWYLTDKGWIPWRLMDFSKMRVEVDIYKVVHSHDIPYLDDESSIGGTELIWTPAFGSADFEDQAEILMTKYGEMPDSKLMFPSSISEAV